MVIIDASVAVKWFFDEELTEKAKQLFSAERASSAPALIVHELHSALFKRLKQKHINAAKARFYAEEMESCIDRLVPNEELTRRAAAIMIDLVHPIYDCLYLALAERERVPLVTVDKRLIEAGGRLGAVKVMHLADV